MRLVKAFLLCLSMQALTLSAQMFIFPTSYGPSDKYQVVDTAKYEITYQIAAKLTPTLSIATSPIRTPRRYSSASVSLRPIAAIS